jgi:CheY-like chemotaxis protein
MGAEGAVRDRIEASKNAASRAQDLARQLLTFAKGGAPIKRTASLRQLVQDTVGFSLSGTNIRSSLTLPEDLWPADIDAGQISQVISNLAVNAAQVMDRGGTLYVTGENVLVGDENAPPTLEPGRYVKITVRDEGPGIPEEIQKKIFDPYFTTKPTGNGLGLATSYSIVKNHDGFIGVESLPGQGATFHVYLPASEKEVEPEAAAKAKSTTPIVRQQGKILVLDDEEVICELISYTLTSLGYTVVSSYDAETTLRLYKEAMEEGSPFDLVIMDLTIPGGMGGREAIQELKKIDPKVKGIVSSGYAMDAIMTQCRDYGFCGAIPKPFDLNQLEVSVQEALAL